MREEGVKMRMSRFSDLSGKGCSSIGIGMREKTRQESARNQATRHRGYTPSERR